MIFIIDNILTNEELIITEKLCDAFIPSEFPNLVNSYVRMKLDKECIPGLITKIEDIIEKNIGEKVIIVPGAFPWMNKVNEESNKVDNFHKDGAEISFILYLNENYTGGELEYINENNQIKKIKPKKNMGVIINNKLLHRVLPVENGNRFSIIYFFEKANAKVNKTLL